MATERIEQLKDKLLSTKPGICLERARLVTEFYKQVSMDPVILRRAKLFRFLLEKKSIYIDDEAILVGSQSSRYRACQAYPEVCEWYYDDVDYFEERTTDKFQFLPGEKEEFREIVRQWKGHTFGAYSSSQVAPEVWDMVDAGIFTVGSRNCSTGSHVPDYEQLMQKGYRGVIKELQEKLDGLTDMDLEHHQKKVVWESMIIVLEAMIAFAHRYADLAEQMAEETEDSIRKQQLITMADNMRRVPEYPPENFYQAVQLVWFTHLGLVMEVNGQDHGISRFDQYMYPFYCKDKEKGVSESFFLELIEELRLKVAEILVLRNHIEAEAYAGNPMWFHMVIGGILPNGKDGCNELTDLVLQSIMDVPTKEPCVSFRYHDNVNQKTLRLALEAARQGTGHPAFYNDKVTIQTVLSLGATIKEARNLGFVGCVEAIVPGKTDFNANVGYFNTIKILELALHDGYDPVLGKQLGPHTGDASKFTSMQQVLDAYLIQEQYFMKAFVTSFNKVVCAHSQALPTVFASCFVEGCKEKGRVLQQAGAKIRASTAAITSIANTVDSLAAIDTCVFQKNYLSMEQLLTCLDTDYKDNEMTRQLLLNKAPKFGNDKDEVDSYGHWLMEKVNEDLQQYQDGRGGTLTTVFATQSYNVVQGRYVGATPDGRHAFTPTADNASPTCGADVQGPTAVIHSLAKIDQVLAQNGVLLNQRLDPAIVKGERGLDILESIVRSYFDLYGEHIQFNVIDTETLRKAQQNPEEYKSIMVRVAGYSAYFVELDRAVQEDIINRTVQTGL